jgi:probable F420-dependent oxidoreductase
MSGLPAQLSTGVASFSAEDPGGWAHLAEQARLLDEAGFDRLAVSDHVVFGEALEEYGRPEIGGQAGGRQPTGPDGHWLEPLTTLAYLAGITSRIRLSTGILLAALRRPVVLAKSAATLDALSGGRLDLGVGVGWQRAEYEAAGLDFSARGEILDHTLGVCQTLWREQRAAWDSPELHFEAIHMMPKPVQAGGVPLWISGTVNPRVVRRLARFGTGWIPWGPAAADVATGIRQMKDALADAGRDPGDLQVTGYLPLIRDDRRELDIARTVEAVPRLAGAGVTDFRVSLPRPSPHSPFTTDRSAALDQLSALAAAFRDAAGQL